jgi:hypothetical protein
MNFKGVQQSFGVVMWVFYLDIIYCQDEEYTQNFRGLICLSFEVKAMGTYQCCGNH